MVRRQLPFSESRVPLNAGNLCPSPRVVSEQVEALTQNIDRDVSYTNRAKFAGSPAGGLRLCPHLYNTMAHVERTVEAVASLSSMIRA